MAQKQWYRTVRKPRTAAAAVDRQGIDFLYARKWLSREEWKTASKVAELAKLEARLSDSDVPEHETRMNEIAGILDAIEATCPAARHVLYGLVWRKQTVREVADGLTGFKWQNRYGKYVELNADTIARTWVKDLMARALKIFETECPEARLKALLNSALPSAS